MGARVSVRVVPNMEALPYLQITETLPFRQPYMNYITFTVFTSGSVISTVRYGTAGRGKTALIRRFHQALGTMTAWLRMT